ncbi:EAL domain-containing protein [Noviherbaspirillum pedocola]|uniref:EAL domain-containing protein n=1 Tax=Noviherbaspirillum pedocola TaxID=2801341 RepID=A0A934STS5_9BURK|nr:EAL domain-containing protein [Noviherbaspirillum pedocola]MBK4735063.1 EAL domain-containing protein [Noviherbaspirillum pedocola]
MTTTIATAASSATPADEDARIATLHRYGILDSASEAIFNDLAELAAMTCATPIGAISLIDRDRLWFKAVIGMAVREVPRELAFCDLVLRSGGDVIVPDTRLHPVLASNPLVAGADGLRFYAGTPLIAENGMVMGSVCVIDRQPRDVTPRQMEGLRMLARQAANLLRQRMRKAELERIAAEKRDLAATLAASEARYRSLFDEHPEPIWAFEHQSLRILEANAAAIRALGYSRAELLEMRLHQLWPAEEVAERTRHANAVDAHQHFVNRVLLRKDGTPIVVEIDVKPIALNNASARLVVAVDVTEREKALRGKQAAEEVARNNRERLRAALDSAQMGEWHLDFTSGVQQHSLWHDRCFGYPNGRSDWTYALFLNHVHPRDRSRVATQLDRAKQRGSTYDLQFRAIWPDGSTHWLHAQGQCHLNEGGKPAYMAGFVREVTATVHATRQLALYKRAIESVNAGVVITDASDKNHPVIYANPEFERMTGYAEAEIIGRNCRMLQGPDTDPATMAELRAAIRSRRATQVTMRNYRKDGSAFWNRLQIAPVFDQREGISHYVGIQQDITSLVLAEQSVAAQARQQTTLAGFGLYALSGRSVVEIYEEALRCVVDTLGIEHALIYKAVNGERAFHVAAQRGWTLLAPHEKVIAAERLSCVRLMFDTAQPLNIGDLNEHAALELETLLEGRGLRSALGAVMRSNGCRHGSLAAFSRTARQFGPGEESFLQGMANILAAALDRVQGENDLAFLAHHDVLTGLPNRAMMSDRLARAIERASRHREKLALMFIDLNRFKVINDSLGHHVGDELLKAVAERISACLRKKDLLSRQGGDEYILLIENAENAGTAAAVAEKIQAALKAPFRMLEKEFYLSGAIGIAMYPDDAVTPDDLLRAADAAMYQAKEQKAAGGYRFFTRELNALTQDRLVLEHGLRTAVAHEELRLVYQPKLDLRASRIHGVEALLRWKHPVHGDISPARFIPVAEATGLIIPISEWVLRQACQQARAWFDAGIEGVNIAVNLSARQFHEKRLAHTIADVLDQTRCRPEWISIEITETDIMRDAEDVVEQLRELKRLGISVSIDDFGTGYSSLGYLKRFDVDVLKIDQSFVRDIPADHDSAAIASSIIALAHSLGMAVVAEGVETQEQRDVLTQWDCDAIQGYLIARPMEAADCAALMMQDAAAKAVRTPLCVVG